MWSRIHLIPLLQAEEDRDVVRRTLAQQKMEEELLGKAVPVYNNDRYEIMLLGLCLGMLIISQLRAADICCDSFERVEIDVEIPRPTNERALCTYYGVQARHGGGPNEVSLHLFNNFGSFTASGFIDILRHFQDRLIFLAWNYLQHAFFFAL